MTMQSSYLDEPHAADVAELRRCNELLRGALKLFSTSQEDLLHENGGRSKGWPYTPGDTDSHFSSSTNAMICFSIAACLGTSTRPESELLPLRRPPATLLGRLGPGEHQDAPLQEGLQSALQSILAIIAKKERLLSSTYGGDDPLTLLWLHETARVLQTVPVQEDLRKAAAGLGNWVEETVRIGRFENCKEEWLRPPDNGGPEEVPNHPFIRLRVAQLYNSLRSAALESPNAVNREWYQQIVYRNFGYLRVPDKPFDAAELTFAFEGLLVAGEKPDEHVFDVFFNVIQESQERSPYWRPLRPFLVTPQGLALLPLSVEIASSLLRICARAAKLFPERAFFSEYIHLFKRYHQWLRSREVRRPEGSGWHSEHLQASTHEVHLWETSQVVLFLLLYMDQLQTHIGAEALRAVGLSRQEPKAEFDTWERAIETLEPWPHACDARRVYTLIDRSFVAPRLTNGPSRPSYSLLLYGPPGTGKTVLAAELASALDWELITITPSDFLAEGGSVVEARAKDIFKALEEQDQCVVLFDEIDRLILDRDSEAYRKQGDVFQFMTPSMLVKLKNLRSKRSLIFIIATNYYERIDPAARRPGRIDHRVPLQPPSLDRRRRMLCEAMKRVAGERGWTGWEVPEPDAEEVVAVARSTALWVYGEIDALVVSAMQAQEPPESIGDALLDALGVAEEPQIGVGKYVLRFRREGTEAAQTPWQEFAGILKLLEEVGAFADDQGRDILTVEDRSALREVLSSDGDCLSRLRTVDKELAGELKRWRDKAHAEGEDS